MPIINRDGAQGVMTGNATDAIDQAVPLAQVSDDFDGDARPIGPAPDVGPDGIIRLSIADDGAGVPTLAQGARVGEQHFGLVSMRERAVMIGGTLRITSSPGEGTTVTVQIKP